MGCGLLWHQDVAQIRCFLEAVITAEWCRSWKSFHCWHINASHPRWVHLWRRRRCRWRLQSIKHGRRRAWQQCARVHGYDVTAGRTPQFALERIEHDSGVFPLGGVVVLRRINTRTLRSAFELLLYTAWLVNSEFHFVQITFKTRPVTLAILSTTRHHISHSF